MQNQCRLVGREHERESRDRSQPDAIERLQKAEIVATSIAVTPAVAYNLKRIAAPVNAAKPNVWPNE